MAATLVFLGRLEDAAGAAQLTVSAGSLAGIVAGLDPALATALGDPRVRLALNGNLVADRGAIVLAPGDELAFLPPVSGG